MRIPRLVIVPPPLGGVGDSKRSKKVYRRLRLWSIPRIVTVKAKPHRSGGKTGGGRTGPSCDGFLRIATNRLEQDWDGSGFSRLPKSAPVPDFFYVPAAAASRSAIHTLMIDWRVTPSRPASRSSDSII